MSKYRILLRLVQVFIVAVVMPRVASFVSTLGPDSDKFEVHDFVGFFFALTLVLGTIGSAYFTDATPAPEYEDEPRNRYEERRREREAAYYKTMHQTVPYARKSMILFAVLDGVFNLADAVLEAQALGRFVLGDTWVHNASVSIYAMAVLFFGLSPTIASVYLSKLLSMVNRIPDDYERARKTKSVDWVRTVMGNLGWREYTARDRVEAAATSRSGQSSNHKARVYEAMKQNKDSGRILSFSELRDALGENAPAKSTISTHRNGWLRENGEL